ncbi:MAG: 30S ribosomal protein S20 [bacterium]|nr:30S ribosomal protein S20 [bacterium]
MPQTKSAKKALRTERRRRKVNLAVLQTMKKAVKAARLKPEFKTLTRAASALDRAAKNGIIHKNKASRLKSRLSKAKPLSQTSPSKKSKKKKS